MHVKTLRASARDGRLPVTSEENDNVGVYPCVLKIMYCPINSPPKLHHGLPPVDHHERPHHVTAPRSPITGQSLGATTPVAEQRRLATDAPRRSGCSVLADPWIPKER